MSDLIDRRAAIDALRRAEALTKAFGYHNVIETIRELPSAQQDVIRCRDCKHWHDAPTSDGYNSCEKDALIRHEDFFCAAAERKEGEA